MSDVVIKVENLSKQYRLGTVGTGTLSHDLNRFVSKIRGKEDPYLKIGENNDRTRKSGSDYVWALKNINFEVRQGEVLGIIGRNGAGKSTLLKILSQITRPSTGSVKMKGRVGSLLEVGTGFHSELTGRENIYINGAILGMRKHEIDKRLDEIVDFAGVEKYIDTPVKRYSSGMMVRLGFSVAAHLEPEILIVDEVLAVGDDEFQKKCLGKMNDVSKNKGRTILFVSHNLGTIKKLCDKAILLNEGKLCLKESELDLVLSEYSKLKKKSTRKETSSFISEYFDLNDFFVGDAEGNKHEGIVTSSEDVFLHIKGAIKILHPQIQIGFIVYDMQENVLFISHQLDDQEVNLEEGPMHLMTKLPTSLLKTGEYRIELLVSIFRQRSIFGPEKNSASLTIEVQGGVLGSTYWLPDRWGTIWPMLKWIKK